MNWGDEIEKMIFAYPEDRDNLKIYIRKLLKQQREICAKYFKDYCGKEKLLTKDGNFEFEDDRDIYNAFLNAPEPE